MYVNLYQSVIYYNKCPRKCILQSKTVVAVQFWMNFFQTVTITQATVCHLNPILYCLCVTRYNMWTMATWRTSQWSMCTPCCCVKMFLSSVFPACCTESTL